MRWIDRDDDLDTVLADLGQANTYFIDTEFESTRQRTRLSVLQVSRGEELYLLDALKLTRLRELGPVLIRDDSEWVLHAGLQDVELLIECFRLSRPPRLFDTQIAWGLLSPEAMVSLGYVQFKTLGLRSMKTHQADDWMQRPLPRSQLEYAASDIAHLPALHRELSARLQERGRRHVVDQLCNELLWPKPEPMPDLDLSSFRHAWQLEPRNQAALQAVIAWYNQLPEWERRRAPTPKTLLAVASRLPRTGRDLMRIKGVPPHFAGALADTLARDMTRASELVSVGQFVQLDPIPYTTFLEVRIEAWLEGLRAEVSAQVEMAVELAFPTRLVRRFKDALLQGTDSTQLPQLLDGWRLELLGPALQSHVVAHPAPRDESTRAT
jgi:ribonuclease D